MLPTYGKIKVGNIAVSAKTLEKGRKLKMGRTSILANQIIERNEHILIAGTTGCGKSSLIKLLLNSILYKDPAWNKLVLIDPKYVELSKFANTQHCLAYSSDVSEIEKILSNSLDMIMDRLKRMRAKGITMWDGSKVYIVIDEMTDLMLTSTKANYLITRIAQLGRAAKVQLITATQYPTRKVIPSLIQANIGIKIGLRASGILESRVIIGRGGLENLPKHGKAIIADANGFNLTDIPYMEDSEIEMEIQARQRV